MLNLGGGGLQSHFWRFTSSTQLILMIDDPRGGSYSNNNSKKIIKSIVIHSTPLCKFKISQAPYFLSNDINFWNL